MPQINYKPKETMKDAFLHSCLGKLTILGAILLVILLIAYMTKPSEQQMMTEMEDNIMQCLEENDSIKGDQIDDFVHNFGHVFSTADTTKIEPDIIKAYYKLNRIEIYKHSFYTTCYIFNNMYPQGMRIGFGAFTLVMPTVTYKDILLNVGPIHKGYDQKVIKTTVIPDTDLGRNPNIQEFHYKRNPDD